MVDIVGLIIEYETEGLGTRDTLELFAELIRTGEAWTLQGRYGRTAKALIDAGIISVEGVVNEDIVPDEE